jgi:FkbM family methyltransferase
MKKQLITIKNQIIEGEKLKDKLILSIYLFLKIFFKNYKIPSDIIITNSAGRFFCYKGSSHAPGCSENYEPEVQKHLKLEKGIFIDVGAYIGRFSIGIANKLKEGKVIAIEPERNNFKTLSKNIYINNLKNIIALDIACSDKKGTTEFYTFGKGTGGSSLVKMDLHDGTVKVKVNTIDNLVKDFKLKSLDLLKIDVEHKEIGVLRGAEKSIRKFKPKIIFECYGEDKYKKIEDFLIKLGYEIKRIDYLNYVADPIDKVI